MESGTGTLGTTGTLTTSSFGGTTLNGSNAVGTLSAINATSGNISLTNTSTPLTVTGITEPNSGTATINNTGDVTFSSALSGNYNLNGPAPA